MANEQNLIPNEARTPEERRENARKAGKASGVARAKKKTLRELAEIIGSMPTKNPKTIAIMEKAGFEPEEMTNDMATMLAMQLKSQAGDVAAAKLLAEMRGQYSTRVEVEPVQPKPLIDLTEAKPVKATKKKTGGKK
jgi:hypothetical protein